MWFQPEVDLWIGRAVELEALATIADWPGQRVAVNVPVRNLYDRALPDLASGMLDRENDYIIARSIIDLAHNLGHQVVAEGVEDAATLELLRALGCDVAQGYLFARPGPAPRIRALIEDGPAFLVEALPATAD